MGIIENILYDYKKLIKTQVMIPLCNGDIIRFTFQPQDLPHLLGLQYLVDIPELFEYSQGRLSATNLYKGMCNGTYDIDAFENSVYYPEIYENRIRYFTSGFILKIICEGQIVQFDSKKIKIFSTKLDKVEYIFWKVIKDKNNNYGYLGIGCTAAGKKTDKNYPNTFFFRSDNQYIFNQTQVFPSSILITKRNKKILFYIYWDLIRSDMQKNPHYKYLATKTDFLHSHELRNADAEKHYQLLRADELNKAYLPYMDENFRWSNAEKVFILTELDKSNVLLPQEIKMLLNEYRQKIHSKNSP